MVGEEKVAKQLLEEARNRSDPSVPCEIHSIRLFILIVAGGKTFEENKPIGDESTGEFSSYRSEVEYGDEEGSIIFYCETKNKITF